MLERRIHAYCIHGTWQLHDYMISIHGCAIFHHGISVKPQRKGRTSTGVMIILNLALTHAWSRAGKLKPLTFPSTSSFPGQMIGVTLSFPNFSNWPSDTFKRKAKGSIKLFLWSVYHPHEADEQMEFYDELDHVIHTRSRNSEVLMGADVNCNVGIMQKRFLGYFRTTRIGQSEFKRKGAFIFI